MRNHNILKLFVLFSLVLGAMSLPTPADAASSEATSMTNLVNGERRDRGLDPLTVHVDLVTGAEYQAGRIADRGELFHNDNLGDVTTGWRKLGENVAYAQDVSAAHSALMGSEGHRANILDPDFNQIGIGVVNRSGRVWVAQVFMQGTAAAESGPPADFSGSFYDDDGSVHESDIERLARSGVTQGCGEGKFCPKERVTRGQMAAFLQRALHLPLVGGNRFADDDSSPFEGAIESLAAAGVTSGCGAKNFCPNAPVTRGQMAAFLQRALGLPLGGPDSFTDDNGSPFESAIESLARSGITSGCGTGKFCPDAAVTREQMASFLVRAFNL